MTDWREDRIGSALRGENPMVLARMKSGFAVIGDSQFLPGYCLLLSYPVAGSLNELSMAERSQFLLDMSLVGDAVIRVCKPLRVNYSILMNLDHYLHAHIEARYDWEPDEYRCRPTSCYPKELRFAAQFDYNETRHGDMKKKLEEALLELTGRQMY